MPWLWGWGGVVKHKSLSNANTGWANSIGKSPGNYPVSFSQCLGWGESHRLDTYTEWVRRPVLFIDQFFQKSLYGEAIDIKVFTLPLLLVSNLSYHHRELVCKCPWVVYRQTGRQKSTSTLKWKWLGKHLLKTEETHSFRFLTRRKVQILQKLIVLPIANHQRWGR